jgi:hypothetical protein
MQPEKATFSPAQREALEAAFRDWLGTEWNTVTLDGGTGDVVQLFIYLRAASMTACKSSSL